MYRANEKKQERQQRKSRLVSRASTKDTESVSSHREGNEVYTCRQRASCTLLLAMSSGVSNWCRRDVVQLR